MLVDSIERVPNHPALVQLNVAGVAEEWNRLYVCGGSLAFDPAAPFLARRSKGSAVIEISTVAFDDLSLIQADATTHLAGRTFDDLISGLSNARHQLAARVATLEKEAIDREEYFRFLRAAGRSSPDALQPSDLARQACSGGFVTFFKVLSYSFPDAEPPYLRELARLASTTESAAAPTESDTSSKPEIERNPWIGDALNRKKFELFLSFVKTSTAFQQARLHLSAGALRGFRRELAEAVVLYETAMADRSLRDAANGGSEPIAKASADQLPAEGARRAQPE